MNSNSHSYDKRENTEKPQEKPENSYSQNFPMVNETNYNVHLKNSKGGIVNINVINGANGSIFTQKQPKSQGNPKYVRKELKRENSKIKFNYPPHTSITGNARMKRKLAHNLNYNTEF